MAKARMIDTKFWSDGFIVNLKPLERYLFLYLLTNEHTAICGIYELPMAVMTRETNLIEPEILEILQRFTGKIYYIDGWVYLKNFVKNQSNKSENILKGIKNSRANVPQNILKNIRKIDASSPIQAPPSPMPLSESELKLESESKSELESESLRPVASEGSQINLLIQEFKAVNPSYERIFSNKTERAALTRLAKKYGENLIPMLRALPEIISKPYAPKITTPYELEKGMGKLQAFLAQEKNKGLKNAFVVL